MFPLSINSTFFLRPLIEADAKILAQSIDQNRLYLRQWLPWLDYNKTEQDSLIFIQNSLRLLKDGKCMVMGMWTESEFVGVVSFNEISWPNKRAILGYWIAENHRGKGLTLAAVRGLCHLAFTELKLNSLELRCASMNRPSRNLAEKLEFIHVGTIPEAEWLYDHFVDHEVFAMTKDRFLLTHSAT